MTFHQDSYYSLELKKCCFRFHFKPLFRMMLVFATEKILTMSENIYRLHVERIVKHFLNLLTRNIDFQDIEIR